MPSFQDIREMNEEFFMRILERERLKIHVFAGNI